MNKENTGKAKGGKAAAALLTKEQKVERARNAAKARWSEPSRTNLEIMINSISSGDVLLGSIPVSCHVLDNETRVISGRGMQNSLGFSKDSSGSELTRIISTKLTEYLSPETIQQINNPIEFIRIGSGGSAPKTFGYDATILIDICDALIEARKANRLTTNQIIYAEQAEAIIRSVAKVGIIALVDEATGYQDKREKDTLQKILNKFLQDEQRTWTKTFPDEFWIKLAKVKGYKSFSSMKKPSYVGHWINDIVYSRLAPGIAQKLKEINPRKQSGNRGRKHHQHFNEDYGLPELRNHLNKVMVLMDASSSKEEFERLINRSIPKYNTTLSISFDEHKV